MSQAPRRFYFEQLILNRGFENTAQFGRAIQRWTIDNKLPFISSDAIRAFVTGKDLPGHKTQLIAEFLNDVTHHDLIVAMWRPPETRGVGGYWEEVYVYNRPPRLIRDINIYDPNIYKSDKITYLKYLD